MPLNDAHRLCDATEAAPAVLGDRSNFLGRRGCSDRVVNEPSLVGDIRVYMVSGAAYEAHVDNDG